MDNIERATPREGGMFRRNYLRPEVPLADSARARLRLCRLFESSASAPSGSVFAESVEQELGIRYPSDWDGYTHERFWTDAEIGDVLSALTIWFVLSPHPDFLRHGRRIFAEEHLRYRIDDKGGVHFLVDEEFERVVASAVAGLGAPRFAASLHALHEAMTHLGAARQSGKGLIRGVFEAVESAFLAVINQPSATILNAAAMDRHLKPLLLARYATHGDAEDLAERFMEHFKAWVKSAHPFRHGTPLDQIHEAPLDLAITSATQGIGYLRFLAGLQAGS